MHVRTAALAGALAAAPALADYKTCMGHCMTQHDFDHCHAICAENFAGGSRPAPSSTTTEPPPIKAEDCSTIDLKLDAIERFIQEHYGNAAFASSGIFFLDEEDPFEVYFGPEGQSCEGSIRVDDDCRITSPEGTPLDKAAAREQAIPCKPYGG